MSDFILPRVARPRQQHAKKDSLRTIFKTQATVIHALMLHDIKSRFFGNGWGYALMILWPGVHITVLLLVYILRGHTPPVGDSPLLYAAIGSLPYICFSYIARFTMMGCQQNRSFLQYPIIKPLDMIVARQALELVSVTIITCGLILALVLCDVAVMPHHPVEAALAILSSICLGLGFGVLNSVIVMFVPIWGVVFSITLICMWLTSGVIINPEAMPYVIGDILAWNPLLHSIEWLRSAYYDDYPTRLLDKTYVLFCGGTTFALGLLAERGLRVYTQKG